MSSSIEEGNESETEATSSLKRKITVPDLEVVTIDPYYDLILIVGSREHVDGQKAFQVNRGSMRNVSKVWAKMLTGDWAERKQSEIEFPEDSWKATLLVLRMAHSQFAKLPNELSVEELAALAIMTDKYDLSETVHIMLEVKKWIHPYRHLWRIWPLHAGTQEFVQMALTFQMNLDYDYLVNRLTVEVQVDKADGRFFYTAEDKQVKLRPDLPDRILTCVNDVRTAILQKWIECCNRAISWTLDGGSPESVNKPRCTKPVCAFTGTGILIKGLRVVGLFPVPESPETMYQSVAWYWKKLNGIGAGFKAYAPCDKTHSSKWDPHRSSCNFQRCFGDFGVLDKAGDVLRRYTHGDVYAYLLSNNFLERPF